MKPIDGPFTHIIVGAGSAGCLLANRLSARPENNVLLVEAGGWIDWLKLPVGYFRSINNPSVSRHFATTPSEGTAGRSIDWPRGKVVGGSSSINGLIFIRGQKDTFDSGRHLETGAGPRLMFCPTFAAWVIHRTAVTISWKPWRASGLATSQRPSLLRGLAAVSQPVWPTLQ